MIAPDAAPPRIIAPVSSRHRCGILPGEPLRIERKSGMSVLRRAVYRQGIAAGALMFALCAPCITLCADTPGEVRFNRDVHPILSENCFACHGPAARQCKSELRLDKKEGLFAKAKHA